MEPAQSTTSPAPETGRADGGAAARPRSERIVQLDVLRGVAILLVLGAHQPDAPTPDQWGYPFFHLWGRAGWVGVDLFFCLSGFLVGSLLFNEHIVRGKVNLG